MKEKTFRCLILCVLILGIMGTVFHLLYAADAYERCSIIRFIAEEPW